MQTLNPETVKMTHVTELPKPFRPVDANGAAMPEELLGGFYRLSADDFGTFGYLSRVARPGDRGMAYAVVSLGGVRICRAARTRADAIAAALDAVKHSNRVAVVVSDADSVTVEKAKLRAAARAADLSPNDLAAFLRLLADNAEAGRSI